MKLPTRNRFVTGVALTLYSAMLLLVVYGLLRIEEEVPPQHTGHIDYREDVTGGRLLIHLPKESVLPASSVILPLGPDSGRLPGLPEIWEEIVAARKPGGVSSDRDFFDGIQAIANPGEFVEGAAYRLALPAWIADGARFGDYLCLLNSHGDLYILDISLPHKPDIVKIIDDPMVVKGMAVRDGIGFMIMSLPTMRYPELHIMDLNDPNRSETLYQMRLPEGATNISMSREYLFVGIDRRTAPADRVMIYRLDDDRRPHLAVEVESRFLDKGFLHAGDYTYVPGQRSGLDVFDLGDPLHPRLVSHLDFPDQARNLSQFGDRLFAKTDSDRLYVISLADPDSPQIVRITQDAELTSYLKFVGQYTYFFLRNGYLQVYDRLPEDRQRFGRQKVFAAAGAFVLPGREPRELLPVSPVTLGGDAVSSAVTLPGRIVDATEWSGRIALLTAGGRLHLYDPQAQFEGKVLTRLQLAKGKRWLATTDELLLAGGDDRLTMISFAGDGSLTIRDEFTLPTGATTDGVVHGEDLFVAAGRDGLLHISLAPPASPRIVETWALPKQIRDQATLHQLSLADGSLFAAAGAAGLLRGELGDDKRLHLTGVMYFDTAAKALAVRGGIALVATDSKVRVVKLDPEGAMQDLGGIDFIGVDRIAMAEKRWAGRVAASGEWRALPVPQLLQPSLADGGLLEMHLPQTTPEGEYCLHLVNHYGISEGHGILRVADMNGRLRLGGPDAP